VLAVIPARLSRECKRRRRAGRLDRDTRQKAVVCPPVRFSRVEVHGYREFFSQDSSTDNHIVVVVVRIPDVLDVGRRGSQFPAFATIRKPIRGSHHANQCAYQSSVQPPLQCSVDRDRAGAGVAPLHLSRSVQSVEIVDDHLRRGELERIITAPQQNLPGPGKPSRCVVLGP